jgi:phage N-6-adenine-methyltransferase
VRGERSASLGSLSGHIVSPTPQFRFGSCETKLPPERNEMRPRRGRPRKYANAAERLRAFRKRRKRSVHFSSATDGWSTPDEVFQALHAEFHFTCDVCADDSNAKCPCYFTKDIDGLRQPWVDTCWCNPPYGAEIHRWVQKAFESSLFGTTVVCLLPARVDTRWWHQYVTLAEVRYLQGRLKFGGSPHSAPFPSAVVIFRGRECARGAIPAGPCLLCGG